jgi:hypothetical protein
MTVYIMSIHQFFSTYLTADCTSPFHPYFYRSKWHMYHWHPSSWWIGWYHHIHHGRGRILMSFAVRVSFNWPYSFLIFILTTWKRTVSLLDCCLCELFSILYSTGRILPPELWDSELLLVSDQSIQWLLPDYIPNNPILSNSIIILQLS